MVGSDEGKSFVVALPRGVNRGDWEGGVRTGNVGGFEGEATYAGTERG